MPIYLYSDPNGHEVEISHGMTDTITVFCQICGAAMHRKPQRVYVNWGGLPPHLETMRGPAVRSIIDDADRRRDQYESTKDTNIFNDQRTNK